MYDRAPQDNPIRRVMDSCLPGLENRPDFDWEVLRKARGEEKMKKKLSVGFIVVVVLMLIVATALAVITFRETAKWIAQTEREEGSFGYWPVEKKIEVIKALTEQGYIETTDTIKQMCEGGFSQEEANHAANDLIESFTGQNANDIFFLTIMQAAWGPFDEWSHEDRAWYSQLMGSIGIESDGKTVYVHPEGRISEREAIKIARREVANGYGVNESVLDAYRVTVHFQVPEFAEAGDKQPYWFVMFQPPENMEDRLFSAMELYVHPETGELYESVEEKLARCTSLPVRPTNELYQTIDAYNARAREMGYFAFREWPLALRAEYSQEITPKMQAILESGDTTKLLNAGKLDLEVIATSTYLYGLPSENVLSQEEAFALATAALEETYHLSPSLFEKYREINVYYDITDADTPLWKFFFNPKSLPVQELENGYDNPLYDLCYRAGIDAYTGEIKFAEEFAFQTLGQDLGYDMKWY